MGLFDLPVCELESTLLVRKQGMVQGLLGGGKRSGPIIDSLYKAEINDIQGQERLLYYQLGYVNPSRVRLNSNPNVSLGDRVYLITGPGQPQTPAQITSANLTRPANVKDIRDVGNRGDEWVLDVEEIRQT